MRLLQHAFFAILFFFFSPIFAASNAEGWHLLMDNKPDEALAIFKKNIIDKDNNKAAEAYRGLSEVSDYLGKDNDACEYYFKSGLLDQNASVFSAGIMKAYQFSRTASGASLKEGYRLLSDLSEKSGVFNGEFKDLLAQRYLNDGDIRKAQKIINSMGNIRTWMMIGPFDNISNSGFNEHYAPESEINFSKTYPAKDGNMTKWSTLENTAATGWIFLENHADASDAVFYFYCAVSVEKPRQATLAFGASGAFKVFFNGAAVLSDSVFRNTGIDMFMRRVTLNKGSNSLLVKLCREAGRTAGEDRSANFNLRLLDDAYAPLTNVSYAFSAAPVNAPERISLKMPAPSPAADSIINPLFNRLKTNDDDLDAAILLMRAYNGMEKTDEGQLLAKKFLIRYPRSGLWHQLYSESLLRAKKLTEGQTELKSAFTASPLNHAAWTNELYIMAKNADPRNILEFIASSPRQSQLTLEAILAALSAHRELGNRAEELKDIGRLEESSVSDDAALGTLTGLYLEQGDVKKAETLIKKYLKHERTNTALFKTLADNALKQGQSAKAADIIKDALTYSPCDAGLYYYLADMFYSRKNYRKAEEYIDRSCAIRPSDAQALNLKGNILVSLGEKEKAQQAFHDAITFTSDDFNAWENLRTLLNKPSLESLAPLPPVDSIIKSTVGWKYRDHENGAILSTIDDVFLYPSRCSRQRTFMVVRLPTQNAIDTWKERTIGYNDYFQTVTIDRALSYSADGKQIQADVADNKIVFKSLQPGDYIVLEWSIKNFFPGEMARHVYGDEDFQLSFPVFDGRLRLITPRNDTIPSTIYGDSITASVTLLDDYRVTRFSRGPYKGIIDESFMATDWPGRNKTTYSTFTGWADIVKWYDDLTRRKNDNSLELKALADSLFADCATPQAKVVRMHGYITGSIRYSYVPFRQSGWIPQDARDVLAAKIGDCKDMAALGKSLLTYGGIPSYLVLVNTTVRQYIDHAFIGPDFNHCILCCVIGGKDWFIDCTDNNLCASSLPKDDQGAMALVIRPGTTTPITLPFDKPGKRLKRRSIIASVDTTGRIVERGVTLRTGIYAAQYRELFRFESEEKKQSIMRRILARSYPDMTLDSFAIDGRLNSLSDSLDYHYAYTAKNAAAISGSTAVLAIHIPDAVEPDEYPTEETRRFPIDLFQADYDVCRQETNGEMSFPKSWRPISLPQNVTMNTPFGAYALAFSQKGNAIFYDRKATFNLTKQIPAESYGKLRDFLNAVSKADAVQLLFFTH
jgi:tetratricopeptide (TPR) repeat protein